MSPPVTRSEGSGSGAPQSMAELRAEISRLNQIVKVIGSQVENSRESEAVARKELEEIQSSHPHSQWQVK